MTSEELEALRAAARAADEQLAADGEGADQEREIRELQEKVKLAELVRVHGGLGRQTAAIWLRDGHLVVVKKPTGAAMDAYSPQIERAQRDEDLQTVQKINDDLVKAHVVYPERSKYLQLEQEQALLRGAVIDAITRLLQVAQVQLEGKARR